MRIEEIQKLGEPFDRTKYWKEVTAAEFGKMFATIFRDEQATTNVRGFWDVINKCAHKPRIRVSSEAIIIHQETAIYNDFMIKLDTPPTFYLHNWGFWS